MADTVHIQLLGGFSVTLDDTRIGPDAFERRSGAELVQFLALAPGRRAHREQVLDALWPDADPAAAANQMHKAASFARKALGRADAVVAADEMLALLPDAEVRIDVDVVTADDTDPATALTHATGPLLPDLPYAEWTQLPRARVHQRHVALLRDAARWDDLLALDPADESAHLALMKQAIDRGDRTGALRRFAELERALAEELGIVPGPTAVAMKDRADALDQAAPAAGRAIRSFVMTDLEGSTRRWEDDPERMSEVLAQHDQLVETALAQHGGEVFKHTGDGQCAAYVSVTDAVQAAVAVQRALQSAEWPVSPRPAVRIGIDMGEAERRGDDWFGRPLNRTARIMSAGSGDQILCSALVAEMSGLDDTADVAFRDLGLFRLPDLAPLRLHRIVADGLVDDAAPPRRSRLAGRPLPTARSRTYGREEELEATHASITDHRITTLVGPGGAGKTHLALDAAAGLTDRFDGGIWLCELGNVNDGPAAIQELLTSVGGLHHSDATVTESIVATVGERATLLVIDNCEHVLEAVREVCAVLARECAGVRILATSRVPLELADESTMRLDPLDREAAAVLFCAEAARHGRHLDPTDPAVDRICDRLDDLPMALRLAAARTRSLDLTTLEALLADRFEHLQSLEPDGLAHHQTLRAAIGWSINALDREARDFLIDLSVFANRFGLDDAAAVTARPGRSRANFLSVLDELVRRSLVMGPEPTDHGPAYRLLESVRLFAREESADDGATHRYIDHIATSVDVWNRQIGSPDNTGVRRFGDRWDDIRRAWAAALEHGRRDRVLEILVATGTYANVAMRFELLEWYARSLPPEPTDFASRAEARAYAGWSVLSTYHGDFALGADLAARVTDHDPELSEGCWAHAWVPWTRGEIDDARVWLDRIIDNPQPESISLAFGAAHLRSIVDFAGGVDIADVAHQLDVLSTGAGASARTLALATRGLSRLWSDGDGALADLSECIELADDTGIVNTSMTARSARALTLAVHGSDDDALEAVAQTLTYAKERGLWSWVLAGLGTAAALFERLERPDLAVTILGARDGADYRSGFTAGLAVLQEARLREAHPDDFRRWWDGGRHLTPADAGTFAITHATDLLAR